MPEFRLTRRAAMAGMAVALLPMPAAAHHGWAWTEETPFTLTGVIEEIYLGNPHAALKVRAEDGLWEVDLAPPSRTIRAGFDETAAKVGDEVTLIGYRSRDHSERRMKAARVTVNGKDYDVYPDQLPET